MSEAQVIADQAIFPRRDWEKFARSLEVLLNLQRRTLQLCKSLKGRNAILMAELESVRPSRAIQLSEERGKETEAKRATVSDGETALEVMTCNNCRRRNPSSAKFCDICGSPMEL